MPGSPVQQRKVFMTMVLKQRPLLVLDSSKAVYSVAGTVIAAAMMEKTTGKSWEDLIEEYINRPFGINAGFGFPNAKDSTEPAGHWDVYGPLTLEANTYWAQFFPGIAPAGNINISISEYAKFIQDILKALENKKSVLTSESAKYLLFGLPENSIGWKNTLWNNFHVATWIGRAPVFSSYVEVIKEKNIGIVVLCNSGTSMGRAGVMNFGKLLRQHYVTE